MRIIYASENSETAALSCACFDEGFFKKGLTLQEIKSVEPEKDSLKRLINNDPFFDYIVINCQDKKLSENLSKEIARFYPEQNIILVSNIASVITSFPNYKVFPNLSEAIRFIIAENFIPED